MFPTIPIIVKLKTAMEYVLHAEKKLSLMDSSLHFFFTSKCVQRRTFQIELDDIITFPNLISIRRADSSECCNWKKPKAEEKISRIVQCCLSSTEALMLQTSCQSNYDDLQNYKYQVLMGEKEIL
ncbi:hypothetical protein APICC_03019 [Apis cerana cerana]|uniref:Uncharacterized protein n=1 Tax=Apis cerana cerana TaxID=94128 RepID=A0A2A3EFT6_APICC|nr:hypothetical protein APICC_03019 [Apis cerana cerana]